MEAIAELLWRIYVCLSSDPRVLYPGSIRSYIYAILDIYQRGLLGPIDHEKVMELIAQNLSGSIKLRWGNLTEVLRDAAACRRAEGAAAQAAPAAATVTVGVEKAPTLAHLVNRHVPYDSPPKRKLEVILSLGLKPEPLGPVSARSWQARGSGHLRGAVSGVREYHLGASPSDVDLVRTAMAFRRRSLLGEPLESRDIYVREYRPYLGKPVYVALDVSGSMKEYLGDATKLQVAKNVISSYVKYLADSRGSVALVLFNVEAEFMWVPYDTARHGRHMREILKYIYAAGGTELASLFEFLRGHGVTEDVVIISDGRTADPERVEAAARRFRRISAVATERSAFLRRLARATGGRYAELTPMLDVTALF